MPWPACTRLCHTYKERTGAYALVPPPFQLRSFVAYFPYQWNEERGKGRGSCPPPRAPSVYRGEDTATRAYVYGSVRGHNTFR